MSTQERRQAIDPREIKRPESRQFLLEEVGDTLLVDNLFAIQLLHREPNIQRANLRLGCNKQISINRERYLEKYGPRQHPATDGIGLLTLTLSKKSDTSIYVGTAHKISYATKHVRGDVIRIDSVKPTNVQSFEKIKELRDFLEERISSN